MVLENSSGNLEVEKLFVFMCSEAGALDSMPTIVDSTASCPACLCLSRVLSSVPSSPHFHFL